MKNCLQNFLRLMAAVLCFSVLLCLASCASSNEKEVEVEDKPVRYRIACLGDSITEGHEVENKDALYVNRLSAEEFIIKAQNVGSSGTTIALPPDEMLRKLAFVNRYKSIDKNSALIFVLGGTNDYGQNVPIGTITDTDPYTFYGALNTLIDGLQADYPDALLLFATPLQRDDELSDGPETSPYNAEGFTLEDYRDAIVAVCEERNIEYIDLYNLEGMRLEDETFSEYYVDGLHPNDAGSTYISKPIIEKVREMLGV